MEVSNLDKVVYPPGCEELSEDLGKDELVKRLKLLEGAFKNMGQENNDQYAGLALHLASDVYMKHSSKDVRQLIACCIADLIRIFAPEAPYKLLEVLKRRLIPSGGSGMKTQVTTEIIVMSHAPIVNPMPRTPRITKKSLKEQARAQQESGKEEESESGDSQSTSRGAGKRRAKSDSPSPQPEHSAPPKKSRLPSSGRQNRKGAARSTSTAARNMSGKEEESESGDSQSTSRGAGKRRAKSVCDVCSKTFTQAGHLKRHKLIHTGHKQFVCDVCSKAFTQAGHLKRHKLIHTGHKQFV